MANDQYTSTVKALSLNCLSSSSERVRESDGENGVHTLLAAERSVWNPRRGTQCVRRIDLVLEVLEFYSLRVC